MYKQKPTPKKLIFISSDGVAYINKYVKVELLSVINILCN